MHIQGRFMTTVAITILVVWFYVHFVKVSKYGFNFNHSKTHLRENVDYRAKIEVKKLQRGVRILMKDTVKEEVYKKVPVPRAVKVAAVQTPEGNQQMKNISTKIRVKLVNISVHTEAEREILKNLQNIDESSEVEREMMNNSENIEENNDIHHNYLVDQQNISKSFQKGKGRPGPTQDSFLAETNPNIFRPQSYSIIGTDLRKHPSQSDNFNYSFVNSGRKAPLIKDLLQRTDIVENQQYFSKDMRTTDAPFKNDVKQIYGFREHRVIPKQDPANDKTIRKQPKYVQEQDSEINRGNFHQKFAYRQLDPIHAIREIKQERIDVTQINTTPTDVLGQRGTDFKDGFVQVMDVPKQTDLDHISELKQTMQRIGDKSCNNCFVHNFRYIINNVNICQTASPLDSIYLFIMIFTVHENFKQREAIRNTWLTYAKQNKGHIRYAFLLGKPENDTLHEKVDQENLVHHDILKEDFLDSYMNLTYKTIMGFKWVVTFCPIAKYVLKTDDDMYVNIPNIVNLLQQFGGKLDNAIVGNCFIEAGPDRNKSSKWYVSKDVYKEKTYPDFCTGTGYLTSINIVQKIYRVSPHVSFFQLEDVYVGFCLRRIGGSVKRVAGFHSDQPELIPCSYKGYSLFTSHRISPETMEEIWKSKCYYIT